MNVVHDRRLAILQALVVGLLLLGLPCNGLAQPTRPPTSQEQVERAVALFQAQDYARALEAFQQLYVDTHSPELLYNIGMTQDRLGRRPEAIRALRLYLSLVPRSAIRADVEATITRLEAPAPAAPAPAPAPVATNVPTPPAPVGTTPTPAGARRPVWPWVVLGGGLLLAGGGLALAGLAMSRGDEATSQPNERAYLDELEAARTQSTVGWVMTGVGLGVAVVGLVTGIAVRPRNREPPAALLHWQARPGGGVLGLTLMAF